MDIFDKHLESLMVDLSHVDWEGMLLTLQDMRENCTVHGGKKEIDLRIKEIKRIIRESKHAN